MLGSSQSDTVVVLNGRDGADIPENDPADTKVTDTSDMLIANVFASLATWINIQ